jgi:hypothetical protein
MDYWKIDYKNEPPYICDDLACAPELPFKQAIYVHRPAKQLL